MLKTRGWSRILVLGVDAKFLKEVLEQLWELGDYEVVAAREHLQLLSIGR